MAQGGAVASDQLLLVAQIGGAHGVRGEVKITTFTADGERLGVVKAVQDFGAGDLLEIQPPAGQTWYAPFTREVVPEVDLAGGKVVIDRPVEVSERD